MADATLSVMMPVTIDDTTLTSTTVSEADYSAYNSGTTYALGDRVISTSAHRIYESGAASNLNHDPTDINNRIPNASGVTWWIDVSATNAWKMFDGESSSATVVATSFTVVVEPGFVSSLYMGGLIGDTATITMKDAPGGTTVYSDTITLENSLPPDWYEYFFSPFEQQRDLVINDFPPYLTCELTVQLSISSGNVECGMFQVGDLRPLGTTQYDAEAIPKTYSYINIDEFGNNKITRRKSGRDMSLEAVVALEYSDTAVDILTGVLDVPSVWVATTYNDHAALRVFGLGSGSMKYWQPGYNKLRIDVKGLI